MTNETWMRAHGRKAVPGSQPVAFFRPDDFTPERFGYQQGVPLYRHEQTRTYTPKPATVAAQQFYDFFVANQNHWTAIARWDNGWPTHDRYLGRARVRRPPAGQGHLRVLGR